jgi:hypothetical protein
VLSTAAESTSQTNHTLAQGGRSSAPIDTQLDQGVSHPSVRGPQSGRSSEKHGGGGKGHRTINVLFGKAFVYRLVVILARNILSPCFHVTRLMVSGETVKYELPKTEAWSPLSPHHLIAALP